MVGVQMDSMGGHQYPTELLMPQNGFGCARPENLLKIVSCAEAEKTERIDAAGPNGIGGRPPISTWITIVGT